MTDDPALPRRTFRDELATELPLLRRRALGLTRNSTAAEDLVQDTVERALRFERSYRPGSNMAAWLSRVMFSVFMSRCRRRQVETRVLQQLGSELGWHRPAAPTNQPWLTRGVETALGALPDKIGAAVVLVDLGDRTYSEAAEELDVPVGTVMSRLHRGRKRLATSLQSAA